MNRIIGMFSKFDGQEDIQVECSICHEKLFIKKEDEYKQVYCFGCNLREIVQDDLDRKLQFNSVLASHMIMLRNGFTINPLYTGNESETQCRYIKNYDNL